MKKEDLNQFKGEVKDAIRSWGESKIDSIFPKKAQARTFFKNGFNNLLSREDSRVNKWLDTAFLFIANEDGTVDSDVMIDTLAGLFQEMDVKEYLHGMIKMVVGKGEAVISLQQNFMLDMLVGDLGSLKFTVADIQELKEFFND